jgi:hypothetical protein
MHLPQRAHAPCFKTANMVSPLHVCQLCCSHPSRRRCSSPVSEGPEDVRQHHKECRHRAGRHSIHHFLHSTTLIGHMQGRATKDMLCN